MKISSRPILRLAALLPVFIFQVAQEIHCAAAMPDSAPPGKTNPASLSDGHGAFATGQYRNLFVEAGHSKADCEKKIDAAFAQLFHGDPATQAIYYPAGSNTNGPLAYLTDIGHNDVRTEGLSYGMIIAVELDKKEEFNALWN